MGINSISAWYIRSQSDGEVKGPFPSGQISQEILLGRYQLDAEVSHDKEEWFLISTVDEIVPDIFAEDHETPGFNDRLEAARRWADERRGVNDIDENLDRRGSESYESAEIKRLHRLAEKGKKKSNPVTTFTQFTVALAIIVTVVVLAFQYSPVVKNTVDCSATIKQGVNLSGCDLSGVNLVKQKIIAANLMNVNLQTANLQSADLSYTNLKYAQLHLANLKYVNFTKANLTGANLLGADLSGAVFSQANLSYANFRDANILTTNFSNARLDHAIWIDGRVCGVNSLGSCN